jgi:hypothetical protein
MNANLLETIESPRTSALVNVVSGYSQFLQTLSSLPATQELLNQIKSDDDVHELLSRIVELAYTPFDTRYENPHDVALASYLWALSMTVPLAAHAVAGIVYGCEGSWWARKLAERLIAAQFERHSVTKVVNQQVPFSTRTKHSATAGPRHYGGRRFGFFSRASTPPRRNQGSTNRISQLNFEAVEAVG